MHMLGRSRLSADEPLIRTFRLGMPHTPTQVDPEDGEVLSRITALFCANHTRHRPQQYAFDRSVAERVVKNVSENRERLWFIPGERRCFEAVCSVELKKDQRSLTSRVSLYVGDGFTSVAQLEELLLTAVAASASRGRKIVHLTFEDVTFGTLLEKCGFTRRSNALELYVDLKSVEYLEQSTSRSHIRLVDFEGRCPEKYLRDYCALKTLINQSARGDRQSDEHVISPAWTRAEERCAEIRETPYCGTLAIDRYGGVIGLSDLRLFTPNGRCAMWEDTVVRPDWRNYGLAAQLKAACLRRLLTTQPTITHVGTLNNERNLPILALNRKFGFRCLLPVPKWEYLAQGFPAS